MQPIGLGLAPHEDHIATRQRQLQRRCGRERRRWILDTGWDWLGLHQEIALRSEGEGCDGGVGTQEALVVAVVGYTIRAGRVVVHETEVVGRVGEDLGDLSELVEAVRDRAGFAGAVVVCRGWFRGVCIDERAIGRERGGFVHAEDGGAGGLSVAAGVGRGGLVPSGVY